MLLTVHQRGARLLAVAIVGAHMFFGVQRAWAEGPAAGIERSAPHALRMGKTTASRSTPRGAVEAAGKYFIEFRARHALSYGHTFLVHGRLNSRGQVGRVTADQVAGLHPAGDGPQLWSVGHVLPVPAETGPSDGDLEDEYISARFRVILDEATYRRLAEHIRAKQNTPTMWHAAMYNCNTWVGEIAHFAGLAAPTNNLLFPADYIAAMRTLNAGRELTFTRSEDARSVRD